ncbi:MAG: protein arginine kinase [Clostridia bacterium]|jgi:protein arginine kinase|nr:protein arginine kinase [Clostridia bacterium]
MAEGLDKVVVSSRIRLARNVNGMPFPKKLSNDERVYSVLLKGIKDAIGDTFEYEYYEMRRMNEVDRMALLEKHLISPDLVRNIENGSVIISRDRTLSIMVNEEDHVRAQCMLEGMELRSAYEKISDIDDRLAENLDIAFDDKLGYLTSCPSNLGTGMRASVMMFLPALTMTNSMNSVINTAQKLGLTARGIYGEGSNADGYMYQISNEISLGISEEDILRRVETFALKVADNEMKIRDVILKEQGAGLIDKITRAYGILTNAYMMTSRECMGNISLVKLGVSYGIIKSTDMKTLNRLTESIGSAEIIKRSGRSLSALERDIERAKTVRNAILRIDQ